MRSSDRTQICNASGELLFVLPESPSIRKTVRKAVKRNTDLTGAVLSSSYSKRSDGSISINVSGMTDLKGANLAGARLAGARLDAVNLRSASLSGADLTGAEVSYANFCGADLSHAELTGIRSWNTDFSGADLRGANLTGARLPWANFTGANLAGADLTGAFLKAANFTSANLDHTTTSGAKLGALTKSTGVSLRGSDLTANSFRWASILGWFGTALVFVTIFWILSRF